MNIKTIIISFILLAFFIAKAFNQFDTIKNGAYLNSTDFSNNKPLFESEFQFIDKSEKCDTGLVDDEIYDYPGPCFIVGKYKIKSANPKIKKKTINNFIWGIYENGSFYLNARKIGMTKGYIKIKNLERYSYFKGIPILTSHQEYRLSKSAFEYGLIGSSITAARINSETKNNIHYILNVKTGMIHLLNKEYLLKIIQPYGDLLLSFNKEENNGSIEVLLKYVGLINKMEK